MVARGCNTLGAGGAQVLVPGLVRTDPAILASDRLAQLLAVRAHLVERRALLGAQALGPDVGRLLDGLLGDACWLRRRLIVLGGRHERGRRPVIVIIAFGLGLGGDLVRVDIVPDLLVGLTGAVLAFDQLQIVGRDGGRLLDGSVGRGKGGLWICHQYDIPLPCT